MVRRSMMLTLLGVSMSGVSILVATDESRGGSSGRAGHDDRRIRHDQAASDFANDGSVLAILRCRRHLGVEHHARRQPNESGSGNESVTNIAHARTCERTLTRLAKGGNKTLALWS